MPAEILTIEEVATLLRPAAKSIDAFVQAGKVAAFKLWGH